MVPVMPPVVLAVPPLVAVPTTLPVVLALGPPVSPVAPVVALALVLGPVAPAPFDAPPFVLVVLLGTGATGCGSKHDAATAAPSPTIHQCLLKPVFNLTPYPASCSPP